MSTTSDEAAPKPEPRPGTTLPPVARWLKELLRPIHWVLTRLYLTVEVIHPERIPADGPVILVPTHRSRWDALLIFCTTERTLRLMTSHDEFLGLAGWIMKRMGAFPVNTQHPSSGMIRLCQEVVRERQALVVFAEGTIFYYPPHHVHPIKPGVAWLALACLKQNPEAPLPIIPIRSVYSRPHPRFRTRIQLIIGDPIDPRPYLSLPNKDAIRTLTADIQRGLGDVVNESLAEMITPRTPKGTGELSGGSAGPTA